VLSVRPPIDASISLRLRLGKPFVIKGVCLFLGAREVQVYVLTGARQRSASNESAKKGDKKGRMLKKQS
jgi:hypothetical protein